MPEPHVRLTLSQWNLMRSLIHQQFVDIENRLATLEARPIPDLSNYWSKDEMWIEEE